ncbi:MAG: hypothetical protein QOG64_992 [Acidimicrobiaceae bacterium]|nr:hypothetical protein [Acidimicrobiaceae bacterium]
MAEKSKRGSSPTSKRRKPPEKKASSATSGGKSERHVLGPLVDQMGPRLREEFEQLHKSEAKVLKALSNPETSAAFAADPLATLSGLGIQIPPIIKQRLKTAQLTANPGDLAQSRSFRLPDGQVVTARINIRFTGTPEAR